MSVRVPRTDAAATALAERYASLNGELALVEGNRAQAIAATNAVADALALPIIEEQAKISAALERWWAEAAPRLTKGKRKSIELGGCQIGTSTGRATLAIGDEAAALAALQAARWGKRFVRVKPSIDRAEISRGLSLAPYADRLAALGIAVAAGVETFFVKRAGGGAGETIAR